MPETENWWVSTHEGKTTMTAYSIRDFLDGVLELDKRDDLIIDIDTAIKISNQYNVTFIKAKKPDKKGTKKN